MSAEACTSVDLHKIYLLAEKLCGYGDQDHEVAELSHEECRALDIFVFECQQCNWWFRQTENATPETSQWICKECAAEAA